MGDDLVALVLIPLVTGLVQVAKLALPVETRDRWTAALAIVVAVGALALYTTSGIGQPAEAPAIAWTGKLIAATVLRGIATGLSAVGLWNIQNDLRSAGK